MPEALSLQQEEKTAMIGCTAKGNNCAFVERDAHRSRQRRSEGFTEETNPIKIRVDSRSLTI
jgi:hypothetical protein